MGGLLHLVQRGEAWAGWGPAQSPPRCTKCNNPPINSQCASFILFDVARDDIFFFFLFIYSCVLSSVFYTINELPLNSKGLTIWQSQSADYEERMHDVALTAELIYTRLQSRKVMVPSL